MFYQFQMMGVSSPAEVSAKTNPLNDSMQFLSVGTNGILIWNVDKNKQLTCHNHESMGTVSCITWIKTNHGMAKTICYGTGLGYLVLLCPNPADVHLSHLPS